MVCFVWVFLVSGGLGGVVVFWFGFVFSKKAFLWSIEILDYFSLRLLIGHRQH